MEEFDRGVRIGSILYEIFCRAYNIDQQFTQEKPTFHGENLSGVQNPVEAMDRSYKEVGQNEAENVEICKAKIVSDIYFDEEKNMKDEEMINISLLNPFQCCLVTEPLMQHHVKPSPDKVTIASLIYLIRLDNVTREILKIIDVPRENTIIKALYTLANKLDHEPGKTKISFKDMVNVMVRFVDNTVELPPEEKVDSKPWMQAVEHNILGV